MTVSEHIHVSQTQFNSSLISLAEIGGIAQWFQIIAEKIIEIS